MKITTWNVNSVRARIERIKSWVSREKPDVLCLQELKCQDQQFPYEVFEDLGYNIEVFGQKTYNGVAILSRTQAFDVVRNIPWESDVQSRGIAASIDDYEILNLYVPNGSEVGSDKYAYKLEWLEHLYNWISDCFDPEQPIVITGDFNIAPHDIDVYDPEAWNEKILCSSKERDALNRILDLGFYDVLHEMDSKSSNFTWWDYRGNMFQRKLGLRIDHFLVTAPFLERIRSFDIDLRERGEEKPSDHAPVTILVDA